MAAGSFNIRIEQGATYREQFTWRTDDGSFPPTGPIIDLSGCTARMQVRATADDPTILTELTTENGGVTIYNGQVSPNLELFISDTATAALDFDTAVYDLFIYWPNGDSSKLMKGTVTTEKDVTK